MKYRPKCLSRTQGSLLPVPNPYGGTGRRENLRTRLRRFDERNCSKLKQSNKQKTTELL